jgi:hypothetical protein
VETTGKEFEYIRYGGSWDDFSDNLVEINRLKHKISFNMLHFLLNYQSIFACVDHFKSLGFHNNSFIIGPIANPKYLDLRHLPARALDKVQTELQNRINNKPGYLLEDSYRNMLAHLLRPLDKDLKNSFDKINAMDQRRGLNSRDVFAELYTYE